jgi:hypothetical protein
MEPDDLLCSRNARPQKALVGRAQWKINQPHPWRENERDWKEHVYRSMRAVEPNLAIPRQPLFRRLEGIENRRGEDGVVGLTSSAQFKSRWSHRSHLCPLWVEDEREHNASGSTRTRIVPYLWRGAVDKR